MKITIRLMLILGCLVGAMHLAAQTADAALDPASIVGIWLLDEGQGETVADSSGNGNDGTIVGASWTDGKFGAGLEFDGTSHVEIPASDTTEDYVDGFTYMIWIKPTGPAANDNTRIIERDWHNPTIQMGPNDFYGSVSVNSDQASTNVRGGVWIMDEWSFVALTYDGDDLMLYVDGEMVGEIGVGTPDEGPVNTSPPNEGAIWLASWKADGWNFTGVLDEAGVFNVPLSDAQIMDIMENGLESASAVSSTGKVALTWGSLRK